MTICLCLIKHCGIMPQVTVVAFRHKLDPLWLTNVVSDFIKSVDLISGLNNLLSVMSIFLPDQIGWSKWIQYMQKGFDFIISVDMISGLHHLLSVFLPDQIGWSRWIQYMQKGFDFIIRFDLITGLHQLLSVISVFFSWSNWMIKMNPVYAKGLWF